MVVWVAIPPREVTDTLYRKATFVDITDNENADVLYDSGANDNVKGDRIFPCDSYKNKPNGYDEMMTMEVNNEPEVLNNLEKRYEKGNNFTYSGSSLVVMDSNRDLMKQLTEENINNFYQIVLERAIMGDFPPHPFALAANAIKEAANGEKNQTVVLSGETGTGKSSMAKLLTGFFTTVSSKILFRERIIDFCIGMAGGDGELEDRVNIIKLFIFIFENF